MVGVEVHGGVLGYMLGIVGLYCGRVLGYMVGVWLHGEVLGYMVWGLVTWWEVLSYMVKSVGLHCGEC